MPSTPNETNVKRMAVRYGVDLSAYDWRAYWDSELSEPDNMDRFRRDFEKIADSETVERIRYEEAIKSIGKKNLMKCIEEEKRRFEEAMDEFREAHEAKKKKDVDEVL